MSSNVKYIPIIIILMILVNVGGGALLLGLSSSDTLTPELARLYFMIGNNVVSIVIMFMILSEGREYRTTYAVTALFITSRVLEIIRYYRIPANIFEMNIVSMYSGGLIFTLAFVYLNVKIFRERTCFYLLGVGALTMLPILFGADMFLMYVDRYVIMVRENIVYFTMTMIIFYLIVILQVFALISMTKDNHFYKRISNRADYHRTTI